MARRSSRSEHFNPFSDPASGVAGGRVTIWRSGAIDAKRRERSVRQFVKRPRSRAT